MVSIATRRPIYRKQPEEFLRKRKLRHIFLKLVKFCQVILILSLLSFFTWSFWFDKESKVKEFFYENTKQVLINSGFAIRTIEISGNSKVSNNRILESMLQNELEDIRSYPIVMLSLEQIKENLSDIRWIEEITLTKRLPGTVIINVIEREPSFLWQHNKQVWVADSKGDLITQDIEKYSNLPIIVGSDPAKEIEEVEEILSKSNDTISNRIVSFTKIGGRRWDVILSNGIQIKLPAEEPDLAWKKLEEFEKTQNILQKNINYIDLRIEGQLVAGLNESADNSD